jgi:hypothetical protein
VDKTIVVGGAAAAAFVVGLGLWAGLHPRHPTGPAPKTYEAASASFRAIFPQSPRETHTDGTDGTHYLFVGGSPTSDEFLAVRVISRSAAAQRDFDQTYETDVIVGHHTIGNPGGPVITVTAWGGFIRESEGSYKARGATVGLGSFTWRVPEPSAIESVSLTGKHVVYQVEAGASSTKAVEAIVGSVRPIGS